MASSLIRFDSNTLRLTRSERMLARFDLLGITAGTLESLSARDCPQADGAIQLSTSLRTSGLVRLVRSVEAEARTLVEPAGASPSKSMLAVVDGGSETSYNIDFAPGSFHYVYKKAAADTREETTEVPDNVQAHDLQSAILLLRSWRPKVGDRGHFYVVSGRFLLRADMTFHGMDVVVVNGAPRPAVRVDGEAVRVSRDPDAAREKRKFQIWLSDDARHVPVRISAESKFGPIVFDLLKYDPRASVACAAADTQTWEARVREPGLGAQILNNLRAKQNETAASPLEPPAGLPPITPAAEPDVTH